MSASVHQLPTPPSIDLAWGKYAEIRQREIDDPTLMVDRAHCEAVATAWEEWRTAYLVSARGRS